MNTIKQQRKATREDTRLNELVAYVMKVIMKPIIVIYITRKTRKVNNTTGNNNIN